MNGSGWGGAPSTFSVINCRESVGGVSDDVAGFVDEVFVRGVEEDLVEGDDFFLAFVED